MSAATATSSFWNSVPHFNLSSKLVPTPTPTSICSIFRSHASQRISLFHSHNRRFRSNHPDRPVARPSFSINCKATTITEYEFPDEVLKSEGPVLVEFIADWCGPCRLVAPAIDWASQEYKDKLKVVKIDHDANPKLIEEYKVYGLPTLIIFKNGEEVPDSRREGAITKVKLKEYLDSLLESVAAA